MDNGEHQNILTAIGSYGKGLLRFIRRRVKNDADAEDILQDVWYQLSSVINSQPVEQMGAWLYRVANNKIIDKRRKKAESLWTHEGDEEDKRSYDSSLTSVRTPEALYYDRIIWQEVFMALDELPPNQKDVFVWHEIEGIPFTEIARRTGEPVGKLVSRKHYAVRYLRKRLQVLYEELTE